MKIANPKVVIIGAGLSGLLIANKLKHLEISIVVLEARDRIGGRIFTLHPQDGPPIEMGATWFGMKHTNLTGLLQELQQPYFEQYIKGTAYFESFSTAPPQAIELPQQDPTFRIAGGSDQIVNKLAGSLDEDELTLGQPVKEINFGKPLVKIKTEDLSIETEFVISTVPPALLVRSIAFEPQLPEALVETALHTHTWMQDAIKTAMIYEDPFWRNKQLSGTIFSNVGPLNEFYDHTDYENSKFALCGFVNDAFAVLDKAQRKERIDHQLDRIFGKPGVSYSSCNELIWGHEKYTKADPQSSVFPHQNNGHEIYTNAFYNNRLFIGGSETSQQFPGYMDGAVYSATSTLEKLLEQIRN